MQTFTSAIGRRALAAAAAMLVLLVLGIAVAPPSAAQSGGATTAARRPLVFIPGLLGSRLCRPNPANPSEPTVVWGTFEALLSFPALRLANGADAATDDVKPCGLVREVNYMGVFTQEAYAPIIRRLEKIGYREGRDLFLFDYDWRRSVFDNAQALDAFVRAKVPEPGRKIDIIAHSMGGLVARVYAVKLNGSARISRLISAGTPFLGSVKVYQTVESGLGVANQVVGGLAGVRRIMLSFPSLFELTARYGTCCGGADGTTAFAPSDMAAWRSLAWEGVEPDAMPDLAATFGRVNELATIVAKPLPAGVEDIRLIGVDQRTPHQFGVEQQGAAAIIRMRNTWDGDGTVVRESATSGRAVVYPTSFADHERILNDEQVQAFLEVALSRGGAQAARAVPVKPRSLVRIVGRAAQLVGVAVLPDQPMYRTGDSGQAHIHVRLGVQQPLPIGALRLAVRTPNGQETPLVLRSNPAASDPTNPFEQTFTGDFQAGPNPGTLTLRATVQVEGGRPRIVERPIAVIAQ